MSKYKKIFSGLGLLSISTLIGASVVACANKKFWVVVLIQKE
ncbi:hypothetical protein NWE57_04635 [Mycoplasmopsis cynos]|nr:hypothetical protein [Mycoplasmopsis cynos]UWV93131.1 hypothetical protein NWE57_04635 [Mycoplasmopsis cynos]